MSRISLLEVFHFAINAGFKNDSSGESRDKALNCVDSSAKSGVLGALDIDRPTWHPSAPLWLLPLIWVSNKDGGSRIPSQAPSPPQPSCQAVLNCSLDPT